MPSVGGRTPGLYAGGTSDVSLVAFGLFLEDRDLGFLFFFPEIVAEAEHRAQRQQRQQELEETFHLNLPFPILFKSAEKSIEGAIVSRNFRALRICFFALAPIY
jgi:hypothetical protein